MFGMGESDNSAVGTPVAAVGTAAANFIGAIETALAASGMHLGVISRSIPQVNQMTNAVSRRNLWVTQRRRLIPGI